MFKSIAKNKEIWAFDCEWVPCPEAGRRLYKLPPDMPDRDVIARMWEEGGATEDNPQPFLKLILCRVVSIAAVIRTAHPNNTVKLELKSLPRLESGKPMETEAAMLALFLDTIGNRAPQLVGYNSLSADLAIMVQRGIVQGITVPAFCKRPDKPWEGVDYFARYGEDHLDLQQIIGSFGKGTPSLNELATLSGIPGKMDMDGQGVASLWLDDDLQSIISYNECDALTTYLVFLRVAHFAGFFSATEYEAEQTLVRDLIQRESAAGRPHLKAYQEEWDRLRGPNSPTQSKGSFST